MHFAEIFLNNVITPELNIFQISGIFPTYFGCFLPANATNKKSSSYRNFTKPFLCNIQSLKTCSLRDKTWNLGHWNWQMWVSRLHHCFLGCRIFPFEKSSQQNRPSKFFFKGKKLSLLPSIFAHTDLSTDVQAVQSILNPVSNKNFSPRQNARKTYFLGNAKDFCPNFSKLFRKKFISCWANFFKSKHCFCSNFPQTCPKFP